MGENVDLHQGMLDSFVSCRCDDRSLGTRYQQEEDARSELSYAEPKDPNASPATPPSSALMENTPSCQGSVLWSQNFEVFLLFIR